MAWKLTLTVTVMDYTVLTTQMTKTTTTSSGFLSKVYRYMIEYLSMYELQFRDQCGTSLRRNDLRNNIVCRLNGWNGALRRAKYVGKTITR